MFGGVWSLAELFSQLISFFFFIWFCITVQSRFDYTCNPPPWPRKGELRVGVMVRGGREQRAVRAQGRPRRPKGI